MARAHPNDSSPGAQAGRPQATAAPPAPAIIAEGLTKRFGGATAVEDVSFTVPRGSTTALLGGNGAGKTTTIAMLLGLMSRSAGRITILGHDMDRQRYAALAQMNFSSPYVDLPHRLTVAQNLRVYGRLYGVRNLRQRLAELARDLDLEALMDRKVGTLSAGQKTRVTLAKALINRPVVLLLDEPTASLDPDTADIVRTLFERYRDQTGAAILLASHNMGEVERMADQVLMMRAGCIVDRGSPQALIERYGRDTMEQVFLDIARGTAEAGTRPRPADAAPGASGATVATLPGGDAPAAAATSVLSGDRRP